MSSARCSVCGAPLVAGRDACGYCRSTLDVPAVGAGRTASGVDRDAIAEAWKAALAAGCHGVILEEQAFPTRYVPPPNPGRTVLR